VLYFFHEVNPYRTATSLISSTFSLYSQSAEQKNEVGDTEFNPSELFLYGTLKAFGFYEIEISAPGRGEGLRIETVPYVRRGSRRETNHM